MIRSPATAARLKRREAAMEPLRSPIPEFGYPLHPDALVSVAGAEPITFETFAIANIDALDAEDLHWIAGVLAADEEIVLGGGASPSIVIELVGPVHGRAA